MNLKFIYKGQVVTVHINDSLEIQKIYESAVSKYDYQNSKELSKFGFNVKLRIKRTNQLLKWNDICSSILLENDTILVEPIENLYNANSQNSLSLKHYDISNFENNQFEHRNFPDNPPVIPTKSANLSHMEPGYHPRLHKYQKSDHSQNPPKENRNISNNFDRNVLRRSLGAAFAPPCDILMCRENNYFGSNTSKSYQNAANSSDSSISDYCTKTPKSYKRKPNIIIGLTEKASAIGDRKMLSKSAPSSPTKPVPPLRSPHTHLSMMNTHNVRTIGKKINLSILKKPNIGLGFTIVTRDNQVIYGSGADMTNSVVILVNKILKNGGAADDGRLIPGDRILEVNSVPVSSLKDTTEKLRAIPENTYVELLISRIEKESQPVSTPSKIPRPSSQLTYEILLDPKHKENQQLGLNIHYRTEKDNPNLGVGIYIHSILLDSPAAEQANLLVNDKLIGINGQSLAEKNVQETINLLKAAMLSSSVLSVTVMREKALDQHDNNSKSIPNLNFHESNIKPDLSHCLLPNKMVMESKSRKSRSKPENKPSANYSRYSSSDSEMQNNEEFYPFGHNAFEREGRGRRSMSEKGKVHDDATQFETYKNRTNSNAISTDRHYSTLPTTSHRRRMNKEQSPPPPPLPNKATLKPSQIKIRNAQESITKSSNGTPNRVPTRSASLRDSSNVTNTEHKSRSPKPFSQTPTNELQPVFNRAMNNSFKKAVQRSLPETNDQKKVHSTNQSASKNYTNNDPTSTQSEKEYQNITNSSTKQQPSDKIPRSNSVKNAEKKKSFDLKNFLAFAPNVNPLAKNKSSGKSDTFPPDKRVDPQLPNYKPNNTIDSKRQHCSPPDPQVEYPFCTDQAIIDSTKRVIEWQKKNADVISKENKQNENFYPSHHQQMNNDARIQKTDMNIRNVNPKKISNQYHYETDPYDTIDATLSSPSGQAKYKVTRGHSRSANNTYDISGGISSRNGANPRSNSTIPHHSNHTRKTTNPENNIYATVNKPLKKDISNKKSTNISQGQRNEYKF